MLFLSYRGKVAGAEKLDKYKAAYAQKKKNKKNQKYRLVPSAIVAYIHYILLE